MSIFTKSIQRYKQSGERSKKSVVNIIMSFGAKGASVMISLLVVPMTINYVNPTSYGIWLTLSSIIAWVSFFDLGLSNGMRNKFAEAKANGNILLARQYVSTTYFTIGSIVLILFIVIEAINLFVSWPSILNVDASYADELRKVFAILTTFFCLEMVVKILLTLLQADQRPATAAWIGVGGQALSLLTIYILTKITNGSLLYLAAFYSGIPTLFILLVSFCIFSCTRYRQFSPSIKLVNTSLIKSIFGLGLQFFFISVSMLVIFQFINIIISRELGPDYVTEYNIAYKYFNIIHSIIIIILVPFWSAFTEAYQKKDFQWMSKVKRALEITWLVEIGMIIAMVLLSDWFYSIWIGDSVHVSLELSIAMAFFFAIQGIGNIYMYLINGIGTIRIQIIVYVIFAILAWPLMHFACQYYGLIGILAIPTLVILVQAILGKIQLEKLLSGNCKGIWGK